MMHQLTVRDRRGIILAASLVFATAAACERSGGDNAAPAEAAATAEASTSGALAAWKKAGLHVSEFRALEDKTALDGDCRAGKVSEVSVVLCEYPDAKAAEKAKPAGLRLIGDATGSSLSNEALLLVVADRHAADPNGRRIQEITKVFRLLE